MVKKTDQYKMLISMTSASVGYSSSSTDDIFKN